VSTPSTGRLVAGIGGVALLGVMFLPWFELGGEAADSYREGQQAAEVLNIPDFPTIDTQANAFEAFESTDLILVAAALGAITLAVIAMTGADRLPAAASAIATVLAGLGALLVLYRLIDPPDLFPESPGFQVEVIRKVGAALGLVTASAVALGDWLGMREEAEA
jgi:hypothetical protein